jgi:signal transduction histidine kinase
MSSSPDLPSTPESNQVVRQLARLVEISVRLNSTLDPDQVLKYIIESAAGLLECEAASILLYDDKRGQLLFTTASGSDSQQLATIPVPVEGSIAGTIFRRVKPLIINNVNQDPRHYSLVGEMVQFQPHSLLGVPMCIQGKCTGVLEALNKKSGDFTTNDAQVLSIIADQAAVAIHNARLVQALQRAYEELSRIDKIKSDFIAIASHELRTPLGVILGYATFLKDEAQGDLSEHADMVLNSAIRLRGLVEAMTNMNLLQLGTVELKLRPVTVQKLVQVVIAEIIPTAEAKGQSIHLELPEEGLMVNADPEKLGLVFTNLLNNAVRFTPEGGSITVRVSASKTDVIIEVEDSGAGIPAGELETIFKEFYQVEDHMTRRQGGLGLGLSIARRLVELHQGELSARSEGRGKGATFQVTLHRSKGEA